MNLGVISGPPTINPLRQMYEISKAAAGPLADEYARFLFPLHAA
jgi:hypothetical protein